MLDKLIELTGGDEKRMKLYLSTYRKGITEYISALSFAIEKNDLLQVRTIVHTAKPLFTIIGFDELWKTANEIEVAIDSNSKFDHSKPQQLIEAMKQSLIDLEKY